GRKLSDSRRNAPPSRNPIAAGNQTGRPESSERSIAGNSNDQTLAAIITPAAKPSMMLRNVRETVLVKNTSDAPSDVTPQVNSPASNACTTGSRFSNHSTISRNHP